MKNVLDLDQHHSHKASRGPDKRVAALITRLNNIQGKLVEIKKRVSSLEVHFWGPGGVMLGQFSMWFGIRLVSLSISSGFPMLPDSMMGMRIKTREENQWNAGHLADTAV